MDKPETTSPGKGKQGLDTRTVSPHSDGVDPASFMILLVDDDIKLLGLLGDYLERFGLATLRCPVPSEGLRLVESAQPDLVVLDVMMPGMDGFEFCRTLRKTSMVPVLMLSARGETVDRIVGLELGADDYMAKPFEPRELLTRIQTILRRTRRPPAQPHAEPENDPPDLVVDTHTRTASLGGQVLDLSTMEFELLALFFTNPGKKFNRDEIMNKLQGFDSPSFSRSVDILVSRLRAKLGENARHPRFIKSVHGYGYVFTRSKP